ncbi:hypothetical protein RUM44_010803 [Polyplax serrata]|uniref:Fukutin n=1 Tax=Polyplax serrata TaxID=468196 RepID=A0ABR1ANA3_POLSC
MAEHHFFAEHVLLPILKAWEIGFWVENIISSKPKRFSTYHANLPLGFILQKGRGAVIVEIALLHEREGDFWWHGSFYQDVEYKSKFSNLGIMNIKNNLVLSEEGALDKFQFKSTIIDDIKVNVPKNIPLFLKDSTSFIECNYEVAHKFHQTYGKDTTPKALKFVHKARKILSTAKTVLDQLEIPFWISSGTLLGYYRQCDVIPYSRDVDIGVFIKDYNEKLIERFKSAHMKLIHQFGRISEGFELSFSLNEIKLDVFFFYDDGVHFWNGGHQIYRKNKTSFGAYKYKYTFPKFTLCWTEFLDMKVRIPCQTETYIKANYGPDWFIPVPKWSWVDSPFNVQKMGEWKSEEIKEVIKIF